MMNPGWATATLGDILDLKYGKGLPERQRVANGKVPVYGSNGVVGYHSESLVQGPAVIIGRKGSAGEVHLCAGDCWPIDTTYYVEYFPSGLPLKYWAMYLKFRQLGQEDKSSAVPSLRRDDVHALDVRMPPLAEQYRIVAKLDVILGKVDACQQRLEKIPAILNRFRQSILAAACSGRLTEDWRGAQAGDDDGLPPGWKWTAVGELVPKGGIFDGPFGSNLKSSDYTSDGVRVIRLQNIGHLEFLGEKKTYVSLQKYETLTRHAVGAGDIIFASFIDDEIRTCVLPALAIKAIAKADCFCIRPYEDKVNRTYLTYQLVCRDSFDTLVGHIHGATRPRINTTQLKQLKVRMCPLGEQNEIVRRVEAMFELADEIEARYSTAKESVDQLTQSILAKAFRGELVPQDPKDKPASALLESIKAEREAGEKKGHCSGKGGHERRD
jgi:type I restriction enzyme S subunit